MHNYRKHACGSAAVAAVAYIGSDRSTAAPHKLVQLKLKLTPTKVYKMLYKAHPTKYAGAMFRSRLEARWAAFFDLMKWRWDYEPEDCEGWTPDFALFGRTKVMRVEVKPISLPLDSIRAVVDLSSAPEFEKVRRQKIPGLIVAGAQPAACVSRIKAISIVFETEPFRFPPPESLQELSMSFSGLCLVKIEDSRYDLVAENKKEPSLFYDFMPDATHKWWRVSVETIDELWQEAGSRVQWRAPT